MKTQKTYMAKTDEVKSEWFVADAADRVLGRLASRIAPVLMGKHKPTYTPHVLTGDFVVVTNAEKIRLTGRKRQQKVYQSYSYYPGGQKIVSFEKMIEKHPERVIELAVRRMLPKNKLAKKMLQRLKVYRGAEHPHQAQQPEALAM